MNQESKKLSEGLGGLLFYPLTMVFIIALYFSDGKINQNFIGLVFGVIPLLMAVLRRFLFLPKKLFVHHSNFDVVYSLFCTSMPAAYLVNLFLNSYVN